MTHLDMGGIQKDRRSSRWADYRRSEDGVGGAMIVCLIFQFLNRDPSSHLTADGLAAVATLGTSLCMATIGSSLGVHEGWFPGAILGFLCLLVNGNVDRCINPM